MLTNSTPKLYNKENLRCSEFGIKRDPQLIFGSALFVAIGKVCMYIYGKSDASRCGTHLRDAGSSFCRGAAQADFFFCLLSSQTTNKFNKSKLKPIAIKFYSHSLSFLMFSVYLFAIVGLHKSKRRLFTSLTAEAFHPRTFRGGCFYPKSVPSTKGNALNGIFEN